MDEKAVKIGLKIKLARIARGYDQYTLASLVGVKNNDISLIERGRVGKIETSLIFKIASAIGLEVSELEPDRFGGK